LNKAKVLLVCQGLGLEESGEKQDLVKRIVADVNERGLKAFFSQFLEKELKQWCLDIGLLKANQTVPAKTSLLDALINNKPVTKSKPKRKKSEPTLNLKKRPELKAGITAPNVHQYYSKPELQKFCEEHGLMTSGRLTHLAARVARFLNGEEEKPTEKKKRKRASSTNKRPAKKPKTTKNEKGKDSEEKKKEKDKEDKSEDSEKHGATEEEHKPKARRSSTRKDAPKSPTRTSPRVIPKRQKARQ